MPDTVAVQADVVISRVRAALQAAASCDGTIGVSAGVAESSGDAPPRPLLATSW